MDWKELNKGSVLLSSLYEFRVQYQSRSDFQFWVYDEEAIIRGETRSLAIRKFLFCKYEVSFMPSNWVPLCTATVDCVSLGGMIAWKYISIFTFRNLPHLYSQFTGYGADFWQLTFIDCADVKIVFVLFIPYEAATYYRSNTASLYLHSYSSCPLYGSKLRCLEYSDLICNDSRRGERERDR